MSLLPLHPRRHLAKDGFTYQVYLAPLEGPRGVNPRVKALVFEREGDGAVFTVPAYGHASLLLLTTRELEDFLARAR